MNEKQHDSVAIICKIDLNQSKFQQIFVVARREKQSADVKHEKKCSNEETDILNEMMY